MPYPKKGENKSQYIKRCVVEVIGEGHTQDEATGKCYALWKTYHASQKAIRKGKAVEVKG